MSDILNKTLWDTVLRNVNTHEAAWLQEKSRSASLELMTAFVAAPRFLPKKIADTGLTVTHPAAPGFSTQGWNVVRLCRVWLLTRLDAADKDAYIKNIETLFDTAEMNELVALYSALPVLKFPENWLFRATDAVRSNMGFVFDAIALGNPYPSEYFSEAAWNQLVLKTIFNDKPIHMITGLEQRANENLALILSDFAHERWAAGRSVAPQVWRLTGKYMSASLLPDMEHLLASPQKLNQQAAAIACNESGYPPAKELLSRYPELENATKSGDLTWADLEFKDLNTYVPEP